LHDARYVAGVNRVRRALTQQRAVLAHAAGRWMAIALLAVGVATSVALVVLWPHGSVRAPGTMVIASGAIEAATVVAVIQESCPIESRPGCRRVEIRLEEGARKGRVSSLMLPGDEATPRLSPGDHIRVTPTTPSIGGVPDDLLSENDPTQAPYSFVDYRRGSALLWLFLAFAALVLVLGRRIGALSLLGAAAGLLLVTKFVAPAILHGSSPIVVALTGAFAAMFASIVPLYGIGAKSLASLAGTAVSLATIGVLAVIGVHLAHITGTASEDATLIRSLGGGRLSLQGLAIAGILVGALGVLNDVTVSQASTVLALRRANPAQSARRLYLSAMEVGRDHLGATVNTLVFAYAGASLPLLLVFSSQAITFGDAVNREIVAAEIVATLVGSLGLIAAVPLTTLAATVLAVRLPTDVIEESAGHPHAH
jgi:uncharacterized membrane protein